MKFRKLVSFLVVVASLSFATESFSQSQIRDVTADVMRGIKFGAGLSYISGDIPRGALKLGILEENMTFSASFGFLYQAMVTGNFGLRPELLYVYQGGAIAYDRSGTEVAKADVTLHYIQAPFLATFRILPHFTFHVGPYIGFLLTGVSSVEIDEGDVDRDKFPEYEGKDFENLDGGIAAGVEYGFNNQMIFGVRVTGAFQRLGDRDGYLSDAKTYSARFYVGYTW